MVTVSSNPQPGSRVQLDIEVPAPEVDRHFATAYRTSPSGRRCPASGPARRPGM